MMNKALIVMLPLKQVPLPPEIRGPIENLMGCPNRGGLLYRRPPFGPLIRQDLLLGAIWYDIVKVG